MIDNEGRTALHLAVAERNATIVDYLVSMVLIVYLLLSTSSHPIHTWEINRCLFLTRKCFLPVQALNNWVSSTDVGWYWRARDNTRQYETHSSSLGSPSWWAIIIPGGSTKIHACDDSIFLQFWFTCCLTIYSLTRSTYISLHEH
jgi:ankyrin repeat protein